MATCSRAPLESPFVPAPALATGLTGTGLKGASWLLTPLEEEEEEMKKRPAALARAADLTKDPVRAGKRRFSPKVPMTTEEEERLIELKLQHMEVRKKLLARTERREELRKRLDEVLFKRRCWAATFANQVFALRADFSHVRHQLRVGWKEGEPLPEELFKARKCIYSADVVNEHIGISMDIGLDGFIEDYRKYRQNEKMRLLEEMEPQKVCSDQNGAPLGPVASN